MKAKYRIHVQGGSGPYWVDFDDKDECEKYLKALRLSRPYFSCLRIEKRKEVMTDEPAGDG